MTDPTVPPAFAELLATTNFSFLRGAAHPEELVHTAAALGYTALGVADHNTLAGVVRAHAAAKEVGIRLVVGARIDLLDGPSLVLLPTDRDAYGRLSRLLTLGKRRAEKGQCHLTLADLPDAATGQIAIVLPPDGGQIPGQIPGQHTHPDSRFGQDLTAIARYFPDNTYLAAAIHYDGEDESRLDALDSLSAKAGTPLLATNLPLHHVPERRPLLDVLTAIREKTTVAAAGFRLEANAERYLKSVEEMARLFRHRPDALGRGIEIVERCRFSLDDLRYEYPNELTTGGRSIQEELVFRTWEGAAERYPPDRYPDGIPERVRGALTHELTLIDKLAYAPYFLTVWDIVRFARSRGILCQGRGSAANSAVCYCLGITAVDPSRSDLLFERFVSEARGEPPDIDVDFEHERREEVIQYVYAKYGRERAGLAATVISYRARSAVREVGKALGLSVDVVGLLAGQVWGRWGDSVDDDRVREIGLDPRDPTLRRVLDLTRQLVGFPRHLSQHVGGFVITRGRLDEMVPIENAAMEDRTVIEWDKDDLESLGMLKVDLLALGMLTCIRKAFDLLRRHKGIDHNLATVPAEDPAVYDMLCRGDSLGVFQVESRAQMAMLPRLRPRDFYDLVVEVAIVRPGPIQGDMVHPYLRRRNGQETVDFPSEELRSVLGKTLGVPLFQEQAMKIAIVAAGFTPTEADQLRRAMATFRKTGMVGSFHDKMINGMVDRGYEREFAGRCFRQIEGFGNYGFPESHAASFALLVYVSSWLKRHHPDVFAAALLNAQPMGFYAPAQIVRDAREHGVELRHPDVNASDWDADLETPSSPAPAPPPPTPTRAPAPQGLMALRLGLRSLKGFREEDADRITAARGPGYGDIAMLRRRARLDAATLERLARGDALSSLGLSRRDAFWAARGLRAEEGATAPADDTAGPSGKGLEDLPLFAAARADGPGDQNADQTPLRPEPSVMLPAAPVGQEVVDDFTSLRLSLRAHPVALLRPGLAEQGWGTTEILGTARAGRRVRLSGLVLVRQRPGTAKGVIFITLEDEAGVANLIVWPPVFEAYRRVVLGAKLLGVVGRIQREGIVVHVVVEELMDLTHELASLTDGTLDESGFTGAIANADEVRRTTRDHRAPDEDEKIPPKKPPVLATPRPTPRPVGTHPRSMRPDLRPGLRIVSRDFH